MRSGGGWSPAVAAETAARAIEAAEAIAADLSRDASADLSDPARGGGPAGTRGAGLRRGHAGLALFFAYLDLSLGQAAAGERAQHHLDEAIDRLASQTAPPAGLYDGFVGVAWVAEHLAAVQSVPDDGGEDEDGNADIDAALLALLRRGPWRGDIDLLEGLVGLGVYALERLPRPAAAAMVPLVVARLDERAERGAHGTVWRDPRVSERPPDSGMAHGSAGVIALLARMLHEGAAGPEAAVLLAATVDGVLGGSCAEAAAEGDLAWCAGDAGLSVALLAAARACGQDDWERAARRLAAAAAARYVDDDVGFDPALCHGTAGLAHLFQRLHLETGDPALLAAARRWLERTLARRRPGAGIGGYLCRGRQADGSFGWIADPGFLGGAAGIGLALLAAATPVEPAWDRLLLLSGRVDDQRRRLEA